MAGVLTYRARYKTEKWYIGGRHFGTKMAVVPGPLNEFGDRGGQPQPRSLDSVAAISLAEHSLSKPPVGRGDFAEPLNEQHEPAPGVFFSQRRLRERGDLIDAIFKDRFDQLLLGGKPSIYRSHSDSGVVRDIIKSRLKPPGGEELSGRLNHALAIALGVFTQRT